VFADATMRAIAAAHTTELDRLSRELWRAHAAGVLDDTTAQAAAEALAARQREIQSPGRPLASRGARGSPRSLRPLRSPDRQASLERRRRLAASGPMPPGLAARFTQGELAALRIVGDEVQARGCCDLHIDAIAARAGVGRTTTQNALRMACKLGMVTVEERRRRGQKSLTNIVRIISAEWLSWLRRGSGFRKSNTTDNSASNQHDKLGLGTQWQRYYRRYSATDGVWRPPERGR
jgi:hypothetical protein